MARLSPPPSVLTKLLTTPCSRGSLTTCATFSFVFNAARWQALIQSERQAHYHSRARQLLKEISFLLDRVELLLADGSLQRHQHQNEASKTSINNECPKSPRAVAQVQAAQRHSTMRARQNRLRERKQELEEERAFCHRCHARHPAHPVAFTRRTGRTTSHNAACRCVPAAPSLAQPGLVVCKRASRLRAAPRPATVASRAHASFLFSTLVSHCLSVSLLFWSRPWSSTAPCPSRCCGSCSTSTARCARSCSMRWTPTALVQPAYPQKHQRADRVRTSAFYLGVLAMGSSYYNTSSRAAAGAERRSCFCTEQNSTAQCARPLPLSCLDRLWNFHKRSNEMQKTMQCLEVK